jgi:hypothetical protein
MSSHLYIDLVDFSHEISLRNEYSEGALGREPDTFSVKYGKEATWSKWRLQPKIKKDPITLVIVRRMSCGRRLWSSSSLSYHRSVEFR